MSGNARFHHVVFMEYDKMSQRCALVSTCRELVHRTFTKRRLLDKRSFCEQPGSRNRGLRSRLHVGIFWLILVDMTVMRVQPQVRLVS